MTAILESLFQIRDTGVLIKDADKLTQAVHEVLCNESIHEEPNNKENINKLLLAALSKYNLIQEKPFAFVKKRQCKNCLTPGHNSRTCEQTPREKKSKRIVSNPFLTFAAQHRASAFLELKQGKHPEFFQGNSEDKVRISHVSKFLGNKWKNMSDEERRPFVLQAQQELETNRAKFQVEKN